jgi:GWxTD domain-containing protein
MKKFLILAAGLLAAAAGLFAGPGPSTALPARYRQWLEVDAAYLIGPKEKEVFQALRTDRERDLFIEAFWKQRDPTPGTERNEFREEHYRRLAYVDQHFGRTGIKPGWKTDRGRIYIILGPPRQDLVYDAKSEVVPVEVWYYQGLAEPGLPDGFSCVFYRPDPAADYELYSPAADGPAKLLRSSNFDPVNVEEAYSRLLEVEPAVAQVSLSLISGEEGASRGTRLASQVLLDSIPLLPQKRVDPDYAVRFLKYKDFVEVDYSVNGIDNRAEVAVLPGPSGISFVHYAIEPARLSVEDEGSRFTTTLELDGQVTDKAGRVVFQFDRKSPVSLSRDQAQRLGSRPVSLQGLFPLAEGTYDLTLILKNLSSKEFTTVEESLVVPASTKGLAAGPLLIGYGAKSEAAAGPELRAFRLGGLQVFVSPLAVFSPSETLQAVLAVAGADRAAEGRVRFDLIGPGGKTAASTSVPLAGRPEPGFVSAAFPLAGLPFGDCRVEAALIDGTGRTALTRAASFGLTPVAGIPRPLVFSEPMPGPDKPVHAYLLGSQYLSLGSFGPADAWAAQAYRTEPSSQAYALGYARVLLALRRFTQARAVLEPFVSGERPEAASLEITAEASRSLGDWGPAAAAYRAYLERYGVKISVLNGLGESCARMGDKAGAVSAFQRSLEIDPAQDDVRRELAALKK